MRPPGVGRGSGPGVAAGSRKRVKGVPLIPGRFAAARCVFIEGGGAEGGAASVLAGS